MAAKFEKHYKRKPIGFANVEESRYLRAEAHLKTRKRHRANVFNENRDISNSPSTASQNTEIQSAVRTKEGRMTRLLQWKTERDRRKKIEQIQKKPAFVVGVVHHRVYSPVSKDNNIKEPPLLTKVQKKVALTTFPKGITKATERRLANKTIVKQPTKGSAKNPDYAVRKEPEKQRKQEQPIAPDDYRFKAPSGLPPMLFGHVAIESMSSHRMSDSVTFSPMTGSASKKSSIPRFMVGDISSKKLNTPAKHEAIADNTKESSIEEISLKLSSSDDEQLNLSNNNDSDKHSNNSNEEIQVEEKDTPTNSNTSTVNSNSPSEPIFFSPYVVSSRGKSNARKGQQLRRGFSLGGSSSNEVPTKDTVMKDLNISVKEEECTARYFQFLLNRETGRLNELCRKWAEIKDDPEIIEDAQYQINQAIGQTNLLINKKFERFHSLVLDCETGKGEMLVTCKDLQGFWDMMYMEVQNCNLRFEKLQKLRSQNWKEDEVEPPNKPIGKKKTVTRKKIIAEKPSLIRSFLAEKKKKMAQKMKDGEDTEQFHITENHTSDKAEKNETSLIQYKTRSSTSVPVSDKKFMPAKQKGTRLSLLRAVQLSGTKIRSPLAVIKVSQMWKTPEVQLDNLISYVNSDHTPERSILKQPKSTTDTDSNIKLIQKVNFDDKFCSNQILIDEETQLKRNLADALARIDSLDFDQPSKEASINAGKKLTFDDDSFEESEDVNGVQQNSEVKDSKSKSLIKVPSITIETATPMKNILLRRSLRRQNAVDEINEKSDRSSSGDTNEYDESVRVLRSRRVTSVDIPKLRRKSLRRVSMNVEESEHKENKTPSKIRRKSSLKSRMNDSKRINSEVDLEETVKDISSNKSSKRNNSRTVKFAEEDDMCAENKPTFPMTPHVKRSTMQPRDKESKSTSKQKQASLETPVKPLERIRRSQTKKK